ncbi:MAG TPA: alkyl hydroperoxide reductase [Rhodospirillaceae bacterium]|nr:MAG: alkyl hydroperoxide reductase [Alphaproteobacteria bacterium GWF2_58_20]HAU29284.1 alkyl hydroperoxide reductase [Rhodospirillaceae bacterium]
MLTVGDKFPAFSLKAVVSREPGGEFTTITNETHAGKWLIVFFWPKDFTFVCPTEIASFGEKMQECENGNTQILGVSTDSEYVHLAWRTHDPNLADLPFPMLSDIKHELSATLGILDKDEGVALRATFIVDPKGIIRHVSVNDLETGRNTDEVMRLLEALQTGKLTPCNWKPGTATLS